MQEFSSRNIEYGYNPEPNTTRLSPILEGVDLIVTFPLNYHTNTTVTESDKGTLVFHECKVWQYGAPNDEAFYGEDGTRNYAELGFELDELYEVKDFETEFTKEHADMLTESGMKHYMFFTKEGTLECIAKDVNFQVLK